MDTPTARPSEIYARGDSPHGAHTKILELIGKNKKVLDVGCSTGYLAAALKDNGCFVVGIEKDPESAHEARRYCDKLITADLETLQGLDYPAGYFDCLLFADVLEHLRDPARLLGEFRKYLKSPDGLAVVSLPNVARIDIRLKLLFGRFEYTDSGILDRTHVKFFTLASARRLLSDSGYTVEKVFYTGLADRIKILPGLFSFQFLPVLFQ